MSCFCIVDDGLHTRSLNKQTGAPAQEQSDITGTGTVTNGWKTPKKKINISFSVRYSYNHVPADAVILID